MSQTIVRYSRHRRSILLGTTQIQNLCLGWKKYRINFRDLVALLSRAVPKLQNIITEKVNNVLSNRGTVHE